MTAIPIYRKYYKCGYTTITMSEEKCKCGGYLYLISQYYIPKVNEEAKTDCKKQ